jgi:regulator of sirC expression with transglutaminase-like and TPR domain
MSELRRALVEHAPDIRLDLAALEVAAIEFPGLDTAPSLRELDALASELGARVGRKRGASFVKVTRQYLFEELGFRGNSEDYYNPRNSCLNEVLAARAGIPITLSLLVIEVARRIGRQVQGIGLPGHFVVRIEEGSFSAFLDPFHGGRELSAEQCYERAKEMTGEDFSANPAVLEPVSPRQMLVRMLNNLRLIYINQQNVPKAVQALDLLIAADPDSAEEYKQRGLLSIGLKRYRQSLADLRMYLRLAPPDSSDRKTLEQQVEALRAHLMRLN